MATVRARDEDQKLARKHTLMAAGWALFKENDGQLPSVAQVVKKAGLAKGTFYLYFKTKEELFLELLADAVQRFFDNLKQELGNEAIDLDAIIDTFVRHLSEDETLIQLVQMLFEVGAIISSAVDRAIDDGKPYRAIETGQASRLMLRSYAAFVGIAQMVPAPNSPYIDLPELEPVKLDLVHDTKAIVTSLWHDALINCNG